jgi:hypothetical protein
VRELPPQPAQLALLDDATRAGAAASLLAAGGFLAVDVAPAAATPAPLGATVRTLHQHGLQYWQHIVVADPHQIEANSRSRRQGPAVALVRVHRDVLVLRQPACATAAEAAGSVWSKVVAA